MRRVIYCPDESALDEAVVISKNNFMQIQIGESEAVKNLIFDRNKISVIEIPEFNYVEYKENVDCGLHQIMDYHNDFIVFDESLRALFGGKEIKPLIAEKHYAKFVFTCSLRGERTAAIDMKDNNLERIVFNVN